MRLDIIRQQKQFLISRAQTKLYRNTSQSVTYVLTTKKQIKVKKYFTLTLIILNVILNIIKRGDNMAIEIVPEWMANLDDEDLSFIKNFILSSGSLKEIAKQYEVTYPTVRLRLDRLIQKIQISEDNANEPYISLIKRLAVNDKLDFETAKILVSEYKKMKGVD